MPIPTTNLEKSEKAIIELLKKREGTVALKEVMSTLSDGGSEGMTLLKTAIWHLISQAQIQREADSISLPK